MKIKNINWKNNTKLIYNSYETIKNISKAISFFLENNYQQEDKLIFKNIKTFIEYINIDNNGIISSNDKVLAINEFINIIKLEIENLLKYINFHKGKKVYTIFNIEDKNISLSIYTGG